MKETWIEITGTNGRYSVSNYGNIRSNWSDIPQRNLTTRKRIDKVTQLRAWVHTTGYMRIALGRGKLYYVHRLVAQAFLPNLKNFAQVDHINGDKQNNHVDNLRWVSSKDNAFFGGERHNWEAQKLASARRRVFELQKIEFENLLNQGYSLRAIAKAFGTTHSTVRNTLTRSP